MVGSGEAQEVLSVRELELLRARPVGGPELSLSGFVPVKEQGELVGGDFEHHLLLRFRWS